MKIKKMTVPELQAQIAVLTDQIKKVQDSCQHIVYTSVPGSDTGNYLDPDRYWTDSVCHTCLKKWREYHD
jgi:hypothetical protein